MNLLNKKPNVVSTDLREKHFLFYGAPGTRKTSVAALFPDSIIAATEIGYKLIPGVVAENIDSWATFKAFVRELKKNEVKAVYKTIVIDTVSKLATMCEDYICAINSVSSIREIAWGGGWKQYKAEFGSTINLIAQLGYSIVFIDHAKIKTEESGALSSAATLMDNQCYPIVNQLVDFTLFLQKEVRDNSEDLTDITVYAYSKQSGVVETKTRARHLNPRFEFNFENLAFEIKSAVEKIATVDKKEITNEYTNHYEVVEQTKVKTFDVLKQECLALATALTSSTDKALMNKAVAAITENMKGTRLSEASSERYEDVNNLYEALLIIKGE